MLSRCWYSLVIAYGMLAGTPIPRAAAQDLAIGIKGGVATTGFTGGSGWVNRIGASGGAVVAVGVHPFAVIQVEALVTRAGSDLPRFETPQLLYPAEHVSLTYFQVPVLARLRLQSVVPGFIRPTLMAGPAVSVLLGCRYAREGPDTWSDAPEGVPVSCISRNPRVRANGGPHPDIGVPFSDPRAVDIGVLAGAGLELTVGPSFMTAEARYGRGLLAVDRFEDVRNEGWSFTLGWSRSVRLPH